MDWPNYVSEHWPVIVVSVTLVVAACIDGIQLRVPNWITVPLVLSGLARNGWVDGWSGIGDSVLGMVIGLACLLPLYCVGGMGAGDVKLLAGVGAWLGMTTTVAAFCTSTVIGAVMAVAMVWWQSNFLHHYANLLTILSEWTEIRNLRELSRRADERKPRMLLLPYGIPICVGSILYFMYTGIL